MNILNPLHGNALMNPPSIDNCCDAVECLFETIANVAVAVADFFVVVAQRIWEATTDAYAWTCEKLSNLFTTEDAAQNTLQKAPIKKPAELAEVEVEADIEPLDSMESLINRNEGMARFEQIAKNRPAFQVSKLRVLDYDLDTALSLYDNAEYKGEDFVNLVLWADPTFKDINSFREIAEEKHYNYGHYHKDLGDLTKKRFRAVYCMLREKKAELDAKPNAKAEKHLKTLIKNTAIRINFALNNGNCIVQTNSQTCDLAANVIANASVSANLTDKLQIMAGNAIYKHRNNMMLKVVAKEADDFWGAGNEVYDYLELKNELAKGARDRALLESENVKKFRALYEKAPVGKNPDERPMGFLIRALSDPYGTNLDVGRLRKDLRTFAIHHFGLLNEDWEIEEANSNDPSINEAILEKQRFIAMLSGKKDKTKEEIEAGAPDEDGDAFSIMANTSRFSDVGAKFLLEAAGILEPAK